MIHWYRFFFVSILPLFAACAERNSTDAPEAPEASDISVQQNHFNFGIALTDSVSSPLPAAKLPLSGVVRMDEVTEWTTDIQISTGCESSPEVFTVTKGHGGPADCESLSAVPAMDNNEDYFDSGGWLTWSSSNTDAIMVECTQASHGRTCWLTGYTDLFDAPDGIEPWSTITVCSKNACPPQPSDPICKSSYCIEFEVTSILSVEGEWTVMHDFGKEDFSFQPEQDGRRFKDEWSGVRNGLVSEATARFEVDNILYKGIILPDRKTMYGSAWEGTSMTHLGSWIAKRQLPFPALCEGRPCHVA